MMQKTDLEDEVRRANEAQRILENPLFREAIDQIYNEVDQQWQNSAANEADQREKLWLMRKLTMRIELHLKSVMETGKLARTTLQQKANAAAGLSTLLD